jgi:glutamate-5-semialdehyde dehydrogenase
MAELGARARAASRVLAQLPTSVKDAALLAAADRLVDRTDDLLAANAEDVERATAAGVSPTVIDRLRLDARRVEAMAGGLRQVAQLADPVGEVLAGWVRPNGLRISQVRVPLGVVAIIYENRPNVTSDAAGLCLKSGNAAFLRGSSGAISSNVAVAGVLREAYEKVDVPADALVLVEDTSREAAVEFMQQRDTIDCLIPRGGPSLIASILEHATVPYVIDGDGNCHVYVDESADLDMARSIVVNAKTQRPSVCNAAETLLVHRAVADRFLPDAARDLEGVELVADPAAAALLPGAAEAGEDDWANEFLDLKLAVRVVDSLDDAIEHIARYGSGHSEAIVTGDLAAADRFTAEVDAAAVVVNASTRFVDGEEFGFGAEIGISTQKLHARGPMGLGQLTTAKYVVRGTGQIRS